jgi:hypothetical protein
MKFRSNARTRKLLTFSVSFATIAVFSMTPLMDAALRAGVETGRDVMALLGERSPGERPEGALLQTKLAMAPAQRARPKQYALPKTRERLPAIGPEFAQGPLGFPANSSILPLNRIGRSPGPGYVPPGSPILPPGAPIFSPAVVPPPGGGLPPGDGGTPEIIPPPGGPVPPGTGGPPGGGTPAAPVPEPAIWANMIVGFGAIGLLIRRRRRMTVLGRSSQTFRP